LIRTTSRQTYKIVAYLLSHPHTSQIKVSEAVGVSRNLVNHVVNELETPGVVQQKSKGHLELVDPLKLLEALSMERPISRLVESEIRTEESEPSKVERIVRNAEVHGGGGYALTAFSALSKYLEYYIAYPAVHVYTRHPLELAKAVPRGRGDVTLHLLRPDSEIILEKATRKGEFAVVEPVQVVIDLFGLGGPGRDGAMKLYEQMKQDHEQRT
jgi:biotin operon repressor